MTTYLYCRVSTKAQNIEQQISLLANKHSHDEVLADHGVSGKGLDRPAFNELKLRVTTGDTIICQDLSRLGRNTVEVLEFIEAMTAQGVRVLIDDMGAVDVTSSTGKMVVTTLAAVATMQREQMLEKQAVGIERAKEEGKFKGKQQSPKTIAKCREALEYVEQGLSKEKAAKAAGVGVATLYRYIKEHSTKP